MRRYFARNDKKKEAWEERHVNASRNIAARGMVLLENDGTLPLKSNGAVALYGYGARKTAYCGYGAASTSSREYISIEKGLLDAGIRITTTDYLTRYEKAIIEEEENYFKTIREEVQGTLLDRVIRMYDDPFVPKCQIVISDRDDKNPEKMIAIFVITRVAGEGSDRKPMEGDYYLSEEEKINLIYLSENYKKVIVLLNTCGVIDTKFIRSIPNLGALLFVGLNGGTTGGSVADVLTGKINPEGKLSSTWAENYKDYPNAETFGALNGELDDEYYSEGIYVGYRYFDSFGIVPAYEFGYGKSYTNFSWKAKTVQIDKELLRVELLVKNEGKIYSGREVLQIYVSCPERTLHQPAQKLAGFQKTKLLAPGEEETIIIEIHIPSLVSYREADSSWVLEAGEYLFLAGNSSRNTTPIAVLRLAEEEIIQKCKPVFRRENDIFTEMLPEAEQSILSKVIMPDSIPRMEWKKQKDTLVYTYEKRLEKLAVWENASFLEKNKGKKYTFTQLLEGECNLEELVASLRIEELVLLCVGNVPGLIAEGRSGEHEGGCLVCATSDLGEDIIGSLPLDMIPGASDTTRGLMVSHEIPNMNVCDGGTGLRLVQEFVTDANGKLLTGGLSSVKNVDRLSVDIPPAHPEDSSDEEKNVFYYQYTTALPMATILAQNWDPAVWNICGKIEGAEMQRFGVKLWLGPSMNIHRNPLCGRNFEYYSEDPLLTGKCAASVITGIHTYKGCDVSMKHVACNNQEANRGAVNVHISERVLREIYLRGFEIAVREGNPGSMMTALNLINGVHAANSVEILNHIAREEWGFEGFVMTDWGTTHDDSKEHKYAPSDCGECIKAGNDLIMPGSKDDVDRILESYKRGKVSRAELCLCASNILKVMTKVYPEKTKVMQI